MTVVRWGRWRGGRRFRPGYVIYPGLGEYGRLGNQLWEIAGTLGIAASLDAKARFPRWSYSEHFSLPEHYFCDELPLGTDAATIPVHLPEQVRPYLQDAGLWRAIEPTIRSYFAPSSTTRARLDTKFADFQALPNKTALHIRRGDYLENPRWHPTTSMEYVETALDLLEGTNVVVFSDDIAWCEANLGWAAPAAFMDGNHEYEDLFLMSECEHHVIANSSFSWWGAFLSSDPEPIFPWRWYGPWARVDATPMFLEGWIGIDA